MASIKTEHWQYLCPNSMKEGHKELVALLREMEDLVSERLKRIVEEELMEKRRAFLKGIRSVEAKKKA